MKEINKDIYQKSFIKSGDTYIDIKQMAAFRFDNDEDGYIYAIYQTFDNPDIGIYTRIANKNELSHLFLQLEAFFDDPTLSEQITPLINNIEAIKWKAEQEKEMKKKKTTHKEKS